MKRREKRNIAENFVWKIYVIYIIKVLNDFITVYVSCEQQIVREGALHVSPQKRLRLLVCDNGFKISCCLVYLLQNKFLDTAILILLL